MIHLPLHTNHARRRAIVRWSKRAGLAAAGLAIVGALVSAWLPKPVAVDAGTVRRGPLAVEVDEDGQTRVRDRFVVAAPITGTLQRIELDPGAQVQAGDVIARIDPPDPALLDERSREEATARLAAAIAHQRGADIAIARATLARDAAVREATRTRTLRERGAITESERERSDDQEQLAIRDLAAAEAERARARAEVAAARAVVEPRSPGHPVRAVAVTAPASGQVLRVVRDSAGPVMAGAALVELGDPRALEVVIDVLSSDAARIAPGMPVAIEAWGGDGALRGEVHRVEPSAFTRISALGVEEQRVKVIATIAAPPATLGDGFRVEARIFTWRGDRVVILPASAVFRDKERWAVYAIQGGRARLVPIELGHRGRLEVELASGLGPGAAVVLHPTDQIRDGVQVEPR
ncbi:MAG TPA: HlyD family efflux transporter periplasmic adaptor subunit [Kofleriaceae bacterium]|nr:HlyD family efflux transporter periplasmic adaptor subunit [Kofleriaceae bacterium]